MSESFDPYYKWLAIPPEEQPPHHYRLLGLRLFETDRDVIETAADQRMAHLRRYQAGKFGPQSQVLLNEVAHAKICLMDPKKRARYDDELRQRMAQQAAAASGFAPMAIDVSPARRAQLTLEGLCDGWPALGEIEHVTGEDLYTFSAEDLFDWLRARDDQRQALFIIGHNPALTDLANALAADDGLANLPTAGYLELSLQIDRWRDLRQGCGSIQFSLFPRQL